MELRSTCLEPIWDGPYRMRCGMGAAGVCGRHGRHKPHPHDDQRCKPNPYDDYCHTHGVYIDPYANAKDLTDSY